MSKATRSAFACCQGKERYETRPEAEAALARMLRSPITTDRGLLNAYRCGLCDAYHVGRRKQKGGRR